MDEPGADPSLLASSLRFIKRVNSLFGYTRATIGHLERFSAGWKRGETIQLLDLATGSADVPRAILRWADRRGWDVRIVGVDRHAVTARAAGEGPRDPRLSILQADVFELPFEAGRFDYVLTSMFLHHLSEDEVVRVMEVMDRLSRRGVIVADLLRHRRAYAWITVLTMFSNPMVRHDARVSVKQAFTKGEICGLRDRAEVGYAKYYRHFGHRFVLAGEKGNLSGFTL